MKADKIKREFRTWQKDHPNFMTPTIEKLFKVRGADIVVEVASGTGLYDKPLYGVTAAKRVGRNEFETAPFAEFNKSFHDFDEAERYAKRIKKKLR